MSVPWGFLVVVVGFFVFTKNWHRNLLCFHTGDQENRLLAGEVLEGNEVHFPEGWMQGFEKDKMQPGGMRKREHFSTHCKEKYSKSVRIL